MAADDTNPKPGNEILFWLFLIRMKYFNWRHLQAIYKWNQKEGEEIYWWDPNEFHVQVQGDNEKWSPMSMTKSNKDDQHTRQTRSCIPIGFFLWHSPFCFRFLFFLLCIASRCWGPAANKGGVIVAATSLVSPTVVMIGRAKDLLPCFLIFIIWVFWVASLRLAG